MSIWRDLRKAFDEGRDEEEHGATTAAFLDLMLLAARADRVVDPEELTRVTALLTRHWRTFSGASDEEVARSLAESQARLDAMADGDAQLAMVCRRLGDQGARAAEEGYALAYAVLLAAGGINARERAFADRLRGALGVSSEAAAAVERKLDAAARA
jgi:tellurite resistance protein